MHDGVMAQSCRTLSQKSRQKKTCRKEKHRNQLTMKQTNEPMLLYMDYTGTPAPLTRASLDEHVVGCRQDTGITKNKSCVENKRQEVRSFSQFFFLQQYTHRASSLRGACTVSTLQSGSQAWQPASQVVIRAPIADYRLSKTKAHAGSAITE